MKARRDFIKAFVASAGAMTFSGVANAQNGAMPAIISLLLDQDPQFVLTSAGSGVATVATPFVLSQASFATDTIFLARPVV